MLFKFLKIFKKIWSNCKCGENALAVCPQVPPLFPRNLRLLFVASMQIYVTKFNRGRRISKICLVNLILKSHSKIPRNSKNSHDTQGAKSNHHLSDIISSGPQLIRVMKRGRRISGWAEEETKVSNVQLMFCYGLPKISRQVKASLPNWRSTRDNWCGARWVLANILSWQTPPKSSTVALVLVLGPQFLHVDSTVHVYYPVECP